MCVRFDEIMTVELI